MFFNVSFANNDTVKPLNLTLNHGTPIRLAENAATIAIGDPNVLSVVTIEPSLLMVTGDKAGNTSLTVIGKSGQIYQYRVQVTNDVTQLRTLIQSMERTVSVEDLNGKIILRGEVKTAAALVRVLTMADRFIAGGAAEPDFKVVSDYGGVLAGNLDESINVLDPGRFNQLARTSNNGGGNGGSGSNRGGGGGNGRGNGNQTLLEDKANLAQNISRASVISVANGRILSFIKVTTQPKIEIQMRIVEVDRSKTDQFGIDWRLDGNNVMIGSKVGKVVNVLPSPTNLTDGSTTINTGAANLVGLFTPGKYFLSTFVNFLEEKGATSTLSEPLLTAISGESARFLVGGSVPIPYQTTTSSTNSVAVSTNVRYVQFGLQITVRPTVLENGKISIVLDQSISEADYSNAIQIVGATVPGFKEKSVSTITESASGETWAVAGLLTEEDRKNLQSVPWISKVPILGKLFENKDDTVARNELIILVNARRVDEVNSTTTSFDGQGNLEPSSNKSEEKQDPAYIEKNQQELNSNSIVTPSKKSMTPDTPKGHSEKLIPLNKEDASEDKNKYKNSLPNTKSKKVALNAHTDTDIHTQEPTVKILHLKEKNSARVAESLSEKAPEKPADSPVVAKSSQDLQIFSFDPGRIISEVAQMKVVANDSTQTMPASSTKSEYQSTEKAAAINNAQTATTANRPEPKIIRFEPSDKDLATKELPIVNEKVTTQARDTASTQSTLASNEKSAPTVAIKKVDLPVQVKPTNASPADITPTHTAQSNVKETRTIRGITPSVSNAGEEARSQNTTVAVDNVKPQKQQFTQPSDADIRSGMSSGVDKVQVVVLNFLAGQEKSDFFIQALKKGLTDVPPKSEWPRWKVGVGAIDGNARHLVKFAVAPDMRREIYSGSSAYIEVPKNHFNYAIEYRAQ